MPAPLGLFEMMQAYEVDILKLKGLTTAESQEFPVSGS